MKTKEKKIINIIYLTIIYIIFNTLMIISTNSEILYCVIISTIFYVTLIVLDTIEISEQINIVLSLISVPIKIIILIIVAIPTVLYVIITLLLLIGSLGNISLITESYIAIVTTITLSVSTILILKSINFSTRNLNLDSENYTEAHIIDKMSEVFNKFNQRKLNIASLITFIILCIIITLNLMLKYNGGEYLIFAPNIILASIILTVIIFIIDLKKEFKKEIIDVLCIIFSIIIKCLMLIGMLITTLIYISNCIDELDEYSLMSITENLMITAAFIFAFLCILRSTNYTKKIFNNVILEKEE